MQQIQHKLAHFLLALLSAVICLWAFHTHAAPIYKSIDENGNVIFTDQPLEGAERFDKGGTKRQAAPTEEYEEQLDNQDDGNDEPAARVSVAPIPKDAPPIPQGEQERVEYPPVSRVDILSPINDALLIDPVGKIWVELQSAPTQLKDSGLSAQLWMDKQLVNSGKRPMLSLPIPERGTHELQVKLVDEQERTRVVSDIITFHVKTQLAETTQ